MKACRINYKPDYIEQKNFGFFLRYKSYPKKFLIQMNGPQFFYCQFSQKFKNSLEIIFSFIFRARDLKFSGNIAFISLNTFNVAN